MTKGSWRTPQGPGAPRTGPGPRRTRETSRPGEGRENTKAITGRCQQRHALRRPTNAYAAGSEKAQNAFIEQLFHQIVKQPMLAYGPDVINRLRQSFVAAGFNMQKLLVDMATISALHGIEKPALHSQ